MNISQKFAEWINKTHYHQLPTESIGLVKNAFIDTIGVTIAGSKEPVSSKIIEFARTNSVQGCSTTFTTGYKFNSASASLVNATMAHALDFDDLNPTTKSHPSAVLVPAILAVAEETDSIGEDLITAYIIGLEIMAKIGNLIGIGHYDRGWHSTATLGVFGVTAAAAKLYHLSDEQIINAFGIAASMCSGLRKNFGTMVKPLHCGLAGEKGIMAASLACRGFSADENVFEGIIGFISLYGEGEKTKTDLNFNGALEINLGGLHVKRYPCCYATHRALDAADCIAAENSFEVSDIAIIKCNGPKGAFIPLIHDRPNTSLEAKFSMQYVLAAMVMDRKVGINTFSDNMVIRPEIKQLIPLVHKIEDQTITAIGPSGEDQRYAIVEIILKKGMLLKQRIDTPKGSPKNPLSSEQLQLKYIDCVKGYLSKKEIDDSLELLGNLEHLKHTSQLTRFFLPQKHCIV